ncbi:MAG: hypothetical protein AAF081_19890 [Actinomycetota bacterium]
MRTRLTTRLLVALLAALSLFVAACGSDEVEGETDSSLESSGTSTDTDDSSDDELPADDGGDAATSGLADDDAGDEATSEVIDSAGSGDFCTLYIQNQDLVNEFDFFDPLQVQQWIDSSVGLLDEAIATAPSEIEGDLRIIREDFDLIVEQLVAADYDFFAASTVLETIETVEADAASDRIDAYVESVCGVDPDEAGEDFVENVFDSENVDAILGNETLFNQIIGGMTEDGEMTEEQATCFLSNLDGEVVSGLMADGGAAALSDPQVLQDLLAVFETCGIPLG